MGYHGNKYRQVPFTNERSAPAQNFSVATNDYDRQQAHEGSIYGQPSWQLHFGIVDASFAGLGFHMVTVGDGIGRRPAKGSSNIAPWGASQSNIYSPGSSAIVAVDKRDPDNVVLLAGIPGSSIGSEDAFSHFGQLGPISGPNQDPIFAAFKSCDSLGWIYACDATIPIDNLDTDWRVTNSLGGSIFCSPCEMGMVVDEVTYVRVNTIEQEAEISGRRLSIRADGIELLTPCETISVMKLGGGLKLLEEVELKTVQFDPSMAETDNGFIYQFDNPPVLVYSTYDYGLPSGRVSTTVGQGIFLGGSTDTIQTKVGSMSTGAELRFLDYGSVNPQLTKGWDIYPATAEQSDRDTKINHLKQWSEKEFPTHFQRPLGRLAKLGSEFLACADSFIHLEKIEAGSTTNFKQAISDNESVYSAPERVKLDEVFHGTNAGKKPIGTFCHQTDDGSIFIGNELGAGIRIVGSTVFIEGATIRMAATKDIAAIARDFQVLANRNATIQATRHGRFYTGINLNLISGISGRGGTLSECRGTNTEFELPNDAEDAIFCGITTRAVLSHVTMQGGDVVLDAGVQGGGAILLAAKNSHILTAAAGTISTWCSANLMLYGGSEVQPSSASVFTQAAADFAGQLKASHAWFDGSVSARGNIQSVYGQMGDSDGIFGKVEDTSWFEQGLEQFSKGKESIGKSYSEFVKLLKERLIDKPGVLNRQIRPGLAGGFVPTSDAKAHYGTGNMQTSLARVFQRDLGVGDQPVYSLNVNYRDGGYGAQATYGWPGNTAEIDVPIPSTLDPIYASLKAMFAGQSPPNTTISKEKLAVTLSTFK